MIIHKPTNLLIYHAFYHFNGDPNALLYKLTLAIQSFNDFPIVSHLAELFVVKSPNYTLRIMCTLALKTLELIKSKTQLQKRSYPLPSFPQFLSQHQSLNQFSWHEWFTNILFHLSHISLYSPTTIPQSTTNKQPNEAMIYISN